jgi:purine-binding chemotaxis protein CheW
MTDAPAFNSASALRRDFDLSFARPPANERAALESFLAVRVAGDAYAVRLEEVAGLYADRRIAPLPTPLPSLLGTAGFRGQIAPVYDLAALLGYPSRAAPLRWLVLARAAQLVALAFDAFEAQLIVAPQRVLAGADDEGARRPHVRGAVQTEAAPRPIVRLPSVVEEIRQQVERVHSKKEQ